MSRPPGDGATVEPGARRLLIVTAVAPELAAVRRGLDLVGPAAPPEQAIAAGHRVVVAAGGVGCAAAAAATARSLAMAEMLGAPFTAVISTGVAGGFAGRAEIGSTVLASRSIAADLGADSPEGFLPLAAMGFGPAAVSSDRVLLAGLCSALPGTVVGEVLTVCTVTGTGDGAAALLARYPDGVAEAMEGYGVACAAAQAGIAFAELRTISNVVGPRERSAWRLADALVALTTAFAAVAGSTGEVASLVP